MVVLFGSFVLVIGNVAWNKLFLGVNLIPYGILIIDFLITVFEFDSVNSVDGISWVKGQIEYDDVSIAEDYTIEPSVIYVDT